MTVTIPRDQIHAIAAKYRVDYDLDFDPSVKWVRATAASLRTGSSASPEVLAEADDLDALVDRIEREAGA